MSCRVEPYFSGMHTFLPGIVRNSNEIKRNFQTVLYSLHPDKLVHLIK